LDSVLEEGVVIETHEKTATVRINKARACAHCKAGCMEQGGYMVTEAENPAGAQAGDTVRLRYDPRGALTAVLVVFGLPLMALFLGVILATVMADRMSYQGRTELLSIGIGAILFFLTFIPIKAYDRYVKKSGPNSVTVVSILKKNDLRPET
jgi:sigma-E factor negative regulatory protein RseC